MAELLPVDYLVNEVIPFIDPNMPQLPTRPYLGVMDKPTLRGGISEKDDIRRAWLSLTIMVSLDDEEAASILGQPNPKLPYSFMLDCKEEGGVVRLDTATGRNQRLSRLLETFGLNNGSSTLADFEGKRCLVTPGQEEGTDGVKRNRIIKVEPY